MTSIAEVRVVDFPPLEFTISLDRDRSFVVSEKHGRTDGVFANLSSAILFVKDENRARGSKLIMRFDQNLAFIRAAG
jgi:hypothetical protein